MDFFTLHCQRDSQILHAIKDTNVVKIFKESQPFKSENNLTNYYGVNYFDKNICKFMLKTDKEGKSSITMKKEFEIIDKKSIDDFVDTLFKYVVKIHEDYLKIKSTYYINRINYHNEIYLKKPLTQIYYRVININLDNTYTVFLNNGEVVSYNCIEHILHSFHLTEAKRTMFYNFLKKIRIL